MKVDGRTVLITGGGSGIGLALADLFIKHNSKVIVCGRSEEKLLRVKSLHREVDIFPCDLGNVEERERLARWVQEERPEVDVLVNNAGIQRRVSVKDDTEHWSKRQEEIAINFEAPVHLTSLLLPHLLRQSEAEVVNVSSALAFTPARFSTIYCATKAAIHSFTMSLRLEMAGTKVGVVEIVPPEVNTDLGGTGLHTQGADVNEFAGSVFERLKNGESEIGFGPSEKARLANRDEIQQIMMAIDKRFFG